MSALKSFSRTLPILLAIAIATQFNGGSGFQSYMLVCLLVLGLCSYTLIREGRSLTLPSTTSPLLWLGLFVLWSTFSLFWSQSPGSSVFSQPRLYAGLLAALIAYLASAREHHLSRLGLLLLAVGLSGYSAYQGLVLEISRPAAFFINSNTYAAFLNLILLPTAALYLTRPNRYLIGTALAIIAFASAMTLSRGALLGGVTGLLCLLLLGHKDTTRQPQAKLILWLLVGYLLGSTLAEGIPLSHLEDSVTGDNIASGRLRIWQSSWEMYLNFPILGWGIDTFWQAYPQFRHPLEASTGQNAHNEYLQFLVELGPLGLLLFLTVLVTLTNRVLHHTNRISLEGIGLFAALVALVVQAFFTSTYYHLAIWLLFGWYIGRLSLLTANNTVRCWVPHQHFSRNGYTTLVLLLAAIPASWLGAIFMSDMELKKLETAQSAGEFLKQLPKVERYYNYRDVTQLLFAAQIHSALTEKSSELDNSERNQTINAALTRLKKAERLYPLRADNFLFRAELKQLSPDQYPSEEIITNYQQALERDPYLLRGRWSFARYLQKLGRTNQSVQVLEQGWNRNYYVPHRVIHSYLYALKQAERRFGGNLEIEEIDKAAERIKRDRDRGIIQKTWYLGNQMKKRNDVN